MAQDDPQKSDPTETPSPFCNAAEEPADVNPFATAMGDPAAGEEIELAEEVWLDRSAFGFEPARDDTVDAEFVTEPIPMDVRPVPMKYAAAAAMLLGVLGLFAGRQLSDNGPATLLAATDSNSVPKSVAETPGHVQRNPEKSYMLFATAETQTEADEIMLDLWTLGIEATVEHDLHGVEQRFALVGVTEFDLANGLPRSLRKVLPAVEKAGYRAEPIAWPKPR